MELITTNSQTGQDLTGAGITVATLNAPSFGAALYLVAVRLENLSASGHALTYDLIYGGDQFPATAAEQTNGLTRWFMPLLRVPLAAGAPSVGVSLRDNVGLSDAASFVVDVYREDSVNITSVDNEDADPDAQRVVQIVQRQIIVRNG